MESPRQPVHGLRECRPGQPSAWKTCSRKVPVITTATFYHNTTDAQSSCQQQRSGEPLVLIQGWLEALLPSYRRIRWEIDLVRRGRSDGKKLSIDFHWLLALHPLSVEHHQQAYYRSEHSSLLCPISANSITSQFLKNSAHKAENCEFTGLVNKELSDLWEGSTHEGNSISGPFMPGCMLPTSRTWSPETLPVCTLFYRSLYAMPAQLSNLGYAISSLSACANSNSQDLEKSISSWDPYAGKAIGGLKEL